MDSEVDSEKDIPMHLTSFDFEGQKKQFIKSPYICQMFARLVSKEAAGPQESNKALHSHLKISFQSEN